jgi:hypothetical protein
MTIATQIFPADSAVVCISFFMELPSCSAAFNGYNLRIRLIVETVHYAPDDPIPDERHTLVSTRANAVDRTTTIARNTNIASRARLVNSRVHDANARGTDTRAGGSNIARGTGLIDAGIDNTYTWRTNAGACHAAFRYAHALAINHRVC